MVSGGRRCREGGDVGWLLSVMIGLSWKASEGMRTVGTGNTLRLPGALCRADATAKETYLSGKHSYLFIYFYKALYFNESVLSSSLSRLKTVCVKILQQEFVEVEPVRKTDFKYGCEKLAEITWKASQ